MTQNTKTLCKVIALIGPTASGKTKLAIDLALHYNAVIINLDSVQIYKELNIGSAKPSFNDLKRVKHYLINSASIIEPQNSFTIFQKSYQLIKELKSSHTIILTGGSGLYYKNLLWGMFTTPSHSLPLRNQLLNQNTAELWGDLIQKDPDIAKKIHPNDKMRIARALEVYYTAGKPMSQIQKQEAYTPPADFIFIGVDIPRPILYHHINQRVLDMINQGLIEELKHIIKTYGAPPLLLYKIIGYKELIPYINNEISLDQVVSMIQQNTRRYAKRQLTLFRNLPKVHWLTQPEIQDIITFINTQV